MTTTTGSIDAKLTIDKSSWDRSVAEAKAEAAELGALSPTVRVDANVGPAIAKMAELEAVERGLEATNVRLSAAEKGLNQEQVSSTGSALRLATVEKMLGESRRSETTETAKSTSAKREHTAETERNTESVGRATNANRRHVSGIQVLIALSPAILSAAAPIGAAAIGLGAAFGVMAVSGVLAVKGIKDEMANGTVVGNQYAAGLGSLKTDLNQLSQTSAVAMLGAFSTTVGDINARMPFLNRLVGDSSAMLGAMGGTALRGVIDGMQAMNPLIQTGGVELSKFVTWLFSFSNTNGFSQFVGYAVENLPGVMVLIENLVTTAGHILAAFAPLGPVVLGFLTGLTDGLNNLPLPVLAGLVTTATLLSPALRLAFAPQVAELIGVVAARIGLTGVMANLAVPVVGILTAVIAGLGMAAATSALGTDTGTAALADYGNAVERDNGLIGENVRLQAAHAATTKEMRDAAESLGVSTQTVIQAMMGDKDAQGQLNGIMSTAIDRRQELRRGDENLTDTSLRLSHAKDTLTGGIQSNSTAIQGNVDAYRAYKDATESATGAVTAQERALQTSAAQYGTSVASYQAATAAQEKTAAQLAQTTLNMQLQNDASGLLKQSLDILNGTALSLEQAQTRSAAATNSVTASFVQNGTAIRGGTSAAVANQQALQNKAAADQAAAEAVAKSTGSTKAGTTAYGASKTALENSMRAQGMLTGEVQAYINKLYNVDKLKVKPTKLEVDKARAEADLAAFQAHVDALRGKVIDVITRNSSIGDGTAPSSGTAGRGVPQGFATGGEVQYLASGGQPWQPRGTDTVPAMLTPGEIVVNRASVQSLGAGNVLEANRTGQWPVQQQATAPPPVTVNLVLDGKIIDTRILNLANATAQGAITAADSQSQYIRRGR